ncbi:MAG: UDP-N-acetylmuramate--L-alanine ligase, partial [Saprospiraceae bacterium]|nr:UDP-N-acetylmuramate--L-alanine ligase [Saprospiraceae bacterium]
MTIEKNKPEDVKKVYFIGIGGIGMSALARYFAGKGTGVFGYDKTETPLTKKLVNEGMEIHYVDDPEKIPLDIDLVVYTPAIPSDHKELNFLREKDFRLYKRSEILGWITNSYRSIAVAGTHGKTTTSTLIAYLLRAGGVDCTAFLGGIAVDFEGNFVAGKSDWIVAEADEYDRSFLQLTPEIAVVLSMDADHLDIYGEDKELKKTFCDFADQTKPEGRVVFREGLPLEVKKEMSTMTYGLERGDAKATHIRVDEGYFVFDYSSSTEEINGIKMTLSGRHNIENATAAITVALELGIKPAEIKKALARFKGIKRRFEIVFRDEHLVYIDDYA